MTQHDVSYDKKEEIVNAAFKIIGEEGFSGCTFRAVAREMGQTTGVISHYFKDKNELLLAILSSCFKPWFEELETALISPSPRQALHKMLIDFLPLENDFKSTPIILSSVIQSTFRSDEKLHQLYIKKYAGVRVLLTALIKKGAEKGEFRKDIDAELACEKICALHDGLCFSASLEKHHYTASRLEKIIDAELASMS